MTDTEIKNYNQLYEEKSIRIWLDLSTYCNAKCPQCHRTNANGLGKIDWLPLIQWSAEEFEKMFPRETLESISHFDICGTWGDPIMNKDIFKIVEYIMKNSNSTILINTNGSFRNPDWWWKFGLLGGERITVMWAIEGINQEQHSLYRQNTDLNLILENMETFTLAGGISRVFTVIFKHNEKDMYNIAKMVKGLGAQDIFFVQSNRFYSNKKFDFVDQLGKKSQLEKSTLPDNNFYWKCWSLGNESDMEKILEESKRE